MNDDRYIDAGADREKLLAAADTAVEGLKNILRLGYIADADRATKIALEALRELIKLRQGITEAELKVMEKDVAGALER